MTKPSTFVLLASIAVFITSLCLLVSARSLDSYHFHLSADVNNAYYQRVNHIFQQGSVATLANNEYQPGAMFFFLALSPALLINPSQATYMFALHTVNIALACILGFVAYRHSGSKGLMVYSAILLSIGPISLYRFELFVVTLVILAIRAWQKNRSLAAAFLLGTATATKIYPIIFLPYLIVSTARTRNLLRAIKVCLAFTLGIALFVVPYIYILQATPAQILSEMSFHNKKPIHIESVGGTINTLGYKLIHGSYPQGESGYGIFGLTPTSTFGPITIYNYIWVVAVSAYYFYLFHHQRFRRYSIASICIGLLLIFLATSKTLTPQYFIWFALLFPFALKDFSKHAQIMLFTVIILLNGLTQVIYPLHYTQLLEVYQHITPTHWSIVALTIRNSLLIITLVLFLSCQSRSSHHLKNTK